MVRGGVGDGWAAEHDPSLPPPLRDGPALGAGRRPLVLILTLGAFLITIIFDANVDAQGGAYATGVLVVITSAAVAVTLAARQAQQRKLTVGFGLVALIFVYTTIANIIERPEGVRIASIFIAAILAVSLTSGSPAPSNCASPRSTSTNGAAVHSRYCPPDYQVRCERTRQPDWSSTATNFAR